MASNKITQLTYQMNISNSLEIKEDIYSPIFSTGDNLLWQLWFVPLIKNPVNNKEYCSIYILPVANPDETSWRRRSKFSIKLFVKEIKNFQTYNLISSNNELSISPDTKIENGYGYPEAFERTSLYNGELIISVIFDNIEYKDNKQYNNNVSLDPLPENLVEAWKNHLFNIQPVDVEFDIQGEKFYACSSILIQRSKYFENALSGIWAESTINDQNEKNIYNETKIEEDDKEIDNLVGRKDNLEEEINEEKLNHQIKHRIYISDYKPLSFAKMLAYLYTNQIDWTNNNSSITTDENNNDISFTIEIYCIADRYLLTDLCQRAKNRIFEELTVNNVAEIMFRLVPKYEDLKEPILSFMAENFEAVCNSKGFKDVLANPNDYTYYNRIMSEVLSQHFKIQRAKLNKQNSQTTTNIANVGLPPMRPGIPPGMRPPPLPIPYNPSVGFRQPPQPNNNNNNNNNNSQSN